MDLEGLDWFSTTVCRPLQSWISGSRGRLRLRKYASLVAQRKQKNGVTLLCVCGAIVSLARQQFSSGCWRARPRPPITQSAGALQRDSASCRDRGTARRCAPRCRRAKALAVLESGTLLVRFAL